MCNKTSPQQLLPRGTWTKLGLHSAFLEQRLRTQAVTDILSTKDTTVALDRMHARGVQIRICVLSEPILILSQKYNTATFCISDLNGADSSVCVASYTSTKVFKRRRRCSHRRRSPRGHGKAFPSERYKRKGSAMLRSFSSARARHCSG